MKKTLQTTYMFLVYAILYIPIIVLVLYSLNQAKFSLAWHGFSLRWYKELIYDHALWSAMFNSLILGLCASFIATILGLLPCVYIFLYKRHKQPWLFENLVVLLIILPDLVLGVSLLLFFNLTHIPLGFFSLLIAHITFCIPFVVFMIKSRINNIDVNVYFSALDLGATSFQAGYKILLPLLYPAILSAFLLSFTLSFDDVMISYFVAGPEFNILPLTIYSLVRSGVTPELNALCTVTLLFSMILVYLARPQHD